jgi:hypothetical protein
MIPNIIFGNPTGLYIENDTYLSDPPMDSIELQELIDKLTKALSVLKNQELERLLMRK